MMTTKFQRLKPRICLHTAAGNTTYSLYGGPATTDFSGGSVPRAKAAMVSMITLIQRS
jgi:hypothetical protein